MAAKVGFVIGGTQKGGTTALYTYLNQHPDIGMSKVKEVHYFDKVKRFVNSRIGYARYHSKFPFSERHLIYGESTPSYMYRYNAPKKIWRYNPHMKWILLLRNPVERAFSHWNMQFSKGKDNRTFAQALLTEMEHCRGSLTQCRKFSYIARGFYTEQLRRILLYFPRDQLLVIRSEEMRDMPESVLQQVWAFLGVEGIRVTPLSDEQAHIRSYAHGLQKEEFEALRHIFEYEILQLERMLDWDCTRWLQSISVNSG